MEQGADPNHRDKFGNTPLFLAVSKGNQHADVDKRNEQGNSALINAVQANAIDIVKMLVKAGANVSRKNKLGFSALDIAKTQNPDIYAILKTKSVMGIF